MEILDFKVFYLLAIIGINYINAKQIYPPPPHPPNDTVTKFLVCGGLLYLKKTMSMARMAWMMMAKKRMKAKE